MSKKISWKKLGSRIAYQNPWTTLREDRVINPAGKETIYGLIDRAHPAVSIVALTDEKDVILINTFRYTTQVFSWEIPGGAGERGSPLASAKRELWEETGFRAKRWRTIGRFQSWNGVCNEWTHVYCAEGLTQTGHNEQQEEGISEVKKVSFAKAIEMVECGIITDSGSIAVLMYAALKLGFPFLIKK